ncbi:MAG: hypothetical protein U0931_10505 [Vulcanimicrobiota bacterium]
MNALSLLCPTDDPELQVFKDMASRLRQRRALRERSDIRPRVELQSQHLAVSGGQTSVAMAINTFTHGALTDYDVAARYGYSFLRALQSECPGVYRDWGQMTAHSELWEKAVRPSLSKGVGVLIGLNGEFAAQARGQVVLIVALLGQDQVVYADPTTGSFRTTTRAAMENCPAHPEGKFVFAAA